jgi:hypothetical protein
MFEWRPDEKLRWSFDDSAEPFTTRQVLKDAVRRVDIGPCEPLSPPIRAALRR